MKVKQFEKAIDALSCGIEIDEMKLRDGNVRLVLGHNMHSLLLWDEIGRGFCIPYEDPEFCTADNHQFNAVEDYARDPKFDLKFD